jgi:SWI/SNF-related matrix-associated actin-dependent regulator 1 of chromatin subfamily A
MATSNIKMIPNRYAKPCTVCNARVAEGKGFAFNKGTGWGTVCASSACIDRAGLPQPAPEVREAALEDGVVVVRTPYDPNLLPILRALPGARWDADRKAWTASPKPGDRVRLLELLEQGQIEVSEDLKEVPKDEVTQQAIARATAAGAYSYQLDGIRHLAMRTRALLGDDMGLGKTLQTLMAVPEKGRVLAVVPNSLKLNWREETKKWRPDLTPVVIRSKKELRLPDEGEVVIVNFEALRGFKTSMLKGALSEVILVVDEAHRCKNYKAQQTKAVSAISDACARTWFLTGTPLLNRPFDLYGVLSTGGMAREVFGGWKGFLRCFNGYKNTWGGYDFGTPREDTPERVRRVMLRRLKGDVLDLPAKQYQTLVVDLKDRKLVKAMDDLYLEYGDDVDLPPFEKFSKIRAQLAESRIDAALEYVSECEEQDVPLLVFSAHRAPVLEIGARDGWAAICGDTPPEERQDIVDRFQRGDLKGVALTIQAGGVGLTLTRASTVLFVDLDWTPGNNWQAEDRVHRIGQKSNSVQIVRMVSDHALDQHILDLLSIKQEMIQKAVENRVSYERPSSKGAPQVRHETQDELDARLAAADKEAKTRVARRKIETRITSKKGASTLPKIALTDELRSEIEGAVKALASMCDRAQTKDGAGFNKPDAAAGHWLALTGFANDDYYLLALDMLRKYRGQIGDSFPLVYP